MLAGLNHGDHFTMYTNIESLCCILETNMLYVNCITIQKKVKGKPLCFKTRDAVLLRSGND